MVPPALEGAAKIIGQAEITAQTVKNVAGSENVAAAGATNIWRGTLNKIIVNPYLTTAAAYIMCSARPIKPFVWQLRKAPVFTALVDPTLPNMFERREFVYGAESRGNGGYVLPQLCVRLSAS
jgi:phage major head subunit gpT-like protein